MLVISEALVTYCCTLTHEDEQTVLKYAEENNISIMNAVKDLWDSGEIDIYAGNVTESECNTQDIIEVDKE